MARRASTLAAEYRLSDRSDAARLDRYMCEEGPSGEMDKAVEYALYASSYSFRKREVKGCNRKKKLCGSLKRIQYQENKLFTTR